MGIEGTRNAKRYGGRGAGFIPCRRDALRHSSRIASVRWRELTIAVALATAVWGVSLAGSSAGHAHRAEGGEFLYSEYLMRAGNAVAPLPSGPLAINVHRPFFADGARRIASQAASKADGAPLERWALDAALEEKNADAARDYAADAGWDLLDVAGNELLFSAAANSGGMIRKAGLDIQTELGGRSAQAGIFALGPLVDTFDSALAWQARGYRAQGDTSGFNGGLIYRSAVGEALAGVNAFADYETGEDGAFWRWALGTEMRSAWVDFFFNYYDALTDPRVSGGVEGERFIVYSAGGYDAEINLHSPARPWLAGGAGYYSYDGEFGAEDDSGTRFHIRITPHKSFILEAQYDDPNQADPEWGGRIAFSHSFGAHASGLGAALGKFRPREWLYEPAQREYSQRIRRQRSDNDANWRIVRIDSAENAQTLAVIETGGTAVTLLRNPVAGGYRMASAQGESPVANDLYLLPPQGQFTVRAERGVTVEMRYDMVYGGRETQRGRARLVGMAQAQFDGEAPNMMLQSGEASVLVEQGRFALRESAAPGQVRVVSAGENLICDAGDCLGDSSEDVLSLVADFASAGDGTAASPYAIAHNAAGEIGSLRVVGASAAGAIRVFSLIGGEGVEVSSSSAGAGALHATGAPYEAGSAFAVTVMARETRVQSDSVLTVSAIMTIWLTVREGVDVPAQTLFFDYEEFRLGNAGVHFIGVTPLGAPFNSYLTSFPRDLSRDESGELDETPGVIIEAFQRAALSVNGGFDDSDASYAIESCSVNVADYRGICGRLTVTAVAAPEGGGKAGFLIDTGSGALPASAPAQVAVDVRMRSLIHGLAYFSDLRIVFASGAETSCGDGSFEGETLKRRIYTPARPFVIPGLAINTNAFSDFQTLATNTNIDLNEQLWVRLSGNFNSRNEFVNDDDYALLAGFSVAPGDVLGFNPQPGSATDYAGVARIAEHSQNWRVYRQGGTLRLAEGDDSIRLGCVAESPSFFLDASWQPTTLRAASRVEFPAPGEHDFAPLIAEFSGSAADGVVLVGARTPQPEVAVATVTAAGGSGSVVARRVSGNLEIRDNVVYITAGAPEGTYSVVIEARDAHPVNSAEARATLAVILRQNLQIACDANTPEGREQRRRVYTEARPEIGAVVLGDGRYETFLNAVREAGRESAIWIKIANGSYVRLGGASPALGDVVGYSSSSDAAAFNPQEEGAQVWRVYENADQPGELFLGSGESDDGSEILRCTADPGDPPQFFLDANWRPTDLLAESRTTYPFAIERTFDPIQILFAGSPFDVTRVSNIAVTLANSPSAVVITAGQIRVSGGSGDYNVVVSGSDREVAERGDHHILLLAGIVAGASYTAVVRIADTHPLNTVVLAGTIVFNVTEVPSFSARFVAPGAPGSSAGNPLAISVGASLPEEPLPIATLVISDGVSATVSGFDGGGYLALSNNVVFLTALLAEGDTQAVLMVTVRDEGKNPAEESVVTLYVEPEQATSSSLTDLTDRGLFGLVAMLQGGLAPPGETSGGLVKEQLQLSQAQRGAQGS